MTDIVVILDASGSMETMGNEPVQALNSFIKEQQKANVRGSLFSLYTFASEINKIYDRVDLSTIGDYKDYNPDGMTCLFDCIKQAIHDNRERKNTVFVIITDGDDTASKKCKREEAKQLISLYEKDYNWQLVFLGANQESFKTSLDLGISRGSNVSYSQVKGGDLSAVMEKLSIPIAAYRSASAGGVPKKLNLTPL